MNEQLNVSNGLNFDVWKELLLVKRRVDSIFMSIIHIEFYSFTLATSLIVMDSCTNGLP